jgi:quercetin dioxygenase-like cupin family protein
MRELPECDTVVNSQSLRNKSPFSPAFSRKGEHSMTKTQESLLGRALDLNTLISYQEGSVVSKTLVDRGIGTITLFSFDAGQGLSEHTAPFDAFVQIVDGEAEVTISGETHMVQAGEIIIMPADKPHALRAEKRFAMLLVMIRA